MGTVTSKDGTKIVYEKAGSGPPLILVDGAMCYRASGPMEAVAKLLAPQFTVYRYDRRGRGESGDTAPYAMEREVEDLDALIQEAGGWAYVYGVSSGAALALEGASRGLAVRKLVLYEAPFIVDASRPAVDENYVEELKEMLAGGRRDDMVKSFMRVVGVPGFFIALMRWMPMWPKLRGVAHTLVYDMTIMREYQRGRPLPAGRWTGVRMPTLVAWGSKSPAWMKAGMEQLGSLLPNGRKQVLAGQTHMVRASVVGEAISEFCGI